MNPQSIDEFMEYILALKGGFAQERQQYQAKIKSQEDEIKNLKLTTKPIKNVKA